MKVKRLKPSGMLVPDDEPTSSKVGVDADVSLLGKIWTMIIVTITFPTLVPLLMIAIYIGIWENKIRRDCTLGDILKYLAN